MAGGAPPWWAGVLEAAAEWGTPPWEIAGGTPLQWLIRRGYWREQLAKARERG